MAESGPRRGEGPARRKRKNQSPVADRLGEVEMKKRFIAAAFAVAVALPCLAQWEKNSVVWIDPAEGHSLYLQAAVQKKYTAVEFTTDKAKADYIADLTESSRKGSVARAVILGRPTAAQGRSCL